MPKKLLSVVFILFWFLNISLARAAGKDTRWDKQITILCYHHVNLVKRTPYSVTSVQLENQLNILERSGFKFISLKQLEDYYYKGINIPTLSAVITFDDGNISAYTKAYPIFKQRKIPWALFVYPSVLSKTHEKQALNWLQVKELAKNGVTIGGHTYNHPFLTLPPKEIRTAKQYDSWLTGEINTSKKTIERKLGRPVKYFAIPFGAFDMTVFQKIISSKYRLAFNVHGMNNNGFSNPLNLNRVIISAYDSPETFWLKTMAKPIIFTNINPPDLARITNANPLIKFELKDSTRYVPGTVDLHLSTFKGIKLTHEGDSLYYENQLELHKQRYYVATVTARDRSGNPCRGNWLFLYKKKTPALLVSGNISKK